MEHIRVTKENLAKERCANFLAAMIEKYGKEVLDEIEAEERAGTEKTQKIKHDGE